MQQRTTEVDQKKSRQNYGNIVGRTTKALLFKCISWNFIKTRARCFAPRKASTQNAVSQCSRHYWNKPSPSTSIFNKLMWCPSDMKVVTPREQRRPDNASSLPSPQGLLGCHCWHATLPPEEKKAEKNGLVEPVLGTSSSRQYVEIKLR